LITYLIGCEMIGGKDVVYSTSYLTKICGCCCCFTTVKKENNRKEKKIE